MRNREEWSVICAVVSLLIVFVVQFSFWLMIFMFVYFHRSCWLYCDMCVFYVIFILLKIFRRLHVLVFDGMMKCFGANDGIIFGHYECSYRCFQWGEAFFFFFLFFSFFRFLIWLIFDEKRYFTTGWMPECVITSGACCCCCFWC